MGEETGILGFAFFFWENITHESVRVGGGWGHGEKEGGSRRGVFKFSASARQGSRAHQSARRGAVDEQGRSGVGRQQEQERRQTKTKKPCSLLSQRAPRSSAPLRAPTEKMTPRSRLLRQLPPQRQQKQRQQPRLRRRKSRRRGRTKSLQLAAPRRPSPQSSHGKTLPPSRRGSPTPLRRSRSTSPPRRGPVSLGPRRGRRRRWCPCCC